MKASNASRVPWRKTPNYRYSWQSPPSCLGSHPLNPSRIPWIPRELRLLRTWGWKGFCWPWRNPCSAEAYGVDYSLPFFVDFKAEEIPAATWKNANRKSCVVVWSFCTTAIALGFWNMILNPVNYNRALPNDHLCVSAIVASVLAGSKRPAGPPP